MGEILREKECDILIVGGSTGGVAAALAAAATGALVCLVERGGWLGGQLTSQGVCTPDEQSHIERFGGTRSYYAFREAVRAHYRTTYRLSAEGAAQPHLNPGSCWVSRLSYEPKVGVQILREMLAPHEESGRLQVLYNAEVLSVDILDMEVSSPDASDIPADSESVDSGQIEARTVHSVIVRTEAGETVRILPRYLLDATDLGDLLAMCGVEGVDWVVGAEAQADTGEPDAPAEARPHWIQPFTFPFALEWSPETADINPIAPPHDYAELKALQNYKILHGAISGLFTGRAPWWHYRRLLASANFDDPRIPHDVAMINTAGNDYYGGNILGPDAGNSNDIQATLARARRASLGYVHWLQTECPREDKREDKREENRDEQRAESNGELTGKGYPEFRLRTDLFDTEDGCSPEPYIRESRRIRAVRPVLEQEIVVRDFQGNPCRGEYARAAFMPDTVGIGHYALDIHPNAHGEPNHFVPTRPFQIPLGALVPLRLTNLLPACKNLGTTHLTNGAYRLHPIEWNIGESAALLAAFCLAKRVTPRQILAEEGLLAAFQSLLLERGIPLHWYIDVPLDHPAFRAVQLLATVGIQLGTDTDLLFRPDDPISPDDWQTWRQLTASPAPETFTGTRGEAAIAIVQSD